MKLEQRNKYEMHNNRKCFTTLKNYHESDIVNMNELQAFE